MQSFRIVLHWKHERSLFGVSISKVWNILHDICRTVIEKVVQDVLRSDFLTAFKVVWSGKGFNDLRFYQSLDAIAIKMKIYIYICICTHVHTYVYNFVKSLYS